MKNRIW